MVHKVYCISDEHATRTIQCKILSNGEWYPKYIDSYITQEGKASIISRFNDAMVKKGYKRINSEKIPEEYKK